MKKINILVILLLMFSFNISILKADGISVSSSNIVVGEGKSSTFTIKASSAAGRVDIVSSDTSVVEVSSKSEFVDNSSVNITLKAKKAGNAIITVKLTDVASYNGVELSGNKKINVTVNSGDGSTSPLVVSEIEDLNVSNFEIVGYDIDFDINTFEYNINVDNNVNELYVKVEGDDITVSGDGEVNIEGIKEFKVNISNSNESRDYTFNIIRPENTLIENNKSNNIIMYIIIIVGVLLLITIIVLLTKGKKKNDETLVNIAPSFDPNVPINQSSILNNNFQINNQMNNNSVNNNFNGNNNL